MGVVPEKGADASSDLLDQWNSLNGRAIEKDVYRQQIRIVKAQQLGQLGKVHALSRMLTHSFNGRALAVERVTENDGKNTPVFGLAPRFLTQAFA